MASTCHWEVHVAEVAVIGAGVAGLTAAYVLQRKHDVTLFEADDRLGGHAHTHDLDGVAVDSGFIVHNERTYPNLIRLFRELDVSTQDSEMSMSVRCDGCGLEYAGARKLPGLFAQPQNLIHPPHEVVGGLPSIAGQYYEPENLAHPRPDVVGVDTK